MAKTARFDQAPFHPLTLSAAECEKLEALATKELEKALHVYDDAGPPGARVFRSSRWKTIKTQDDCTVYLDRDSRARSSSIRGSRTSTSSTGSTGSTGSTSASGSSRSAKRSDPLQSLMANGMLGGGAPPPRARRSSRDNAAPSPMRRKSTEGDFSAGSSVWEIPDLVVSGTVSGTLDDVMYGTTTPDSAEMMLRMAYVDDHLLHGAVLAQIQTPTLTEPFRSLVVKWYVKAIPSQYQKLVRPRDFVCIESSGVVTRSDGSRVGYLLRQSVDLPGCDELTNRGMTRGRVANCAIFTPLPNNTVDIFVRGNVDPGGKMASSLAISIAANALLTTSSSVFCAHSKKLLWLLRNQKRDSASSSKSSTRSHTFACGTCAKKFHKLSSVSTCKICCMQLCSKCRLSNTLSYVETQTYQSVEQVAAIVCKNCTTQANQMSAFDVAAREVASGRYGSVKDERKEQVKKDRLVQPAIPIHLNEPVMRYQEQKLNQSQVRNSGSLSPTGFRASSLFRASKILSGSSRNTQKFDPNSSSVSNFSLSIALTESSSRDSEISNFSCDWDPEFDDDDTDDIDDSDNSNQWIEPYTPTKSGGRSNGSQGSNELAVRRADAPSSHRHIPQQQPQSHRGYDREQARREALWQKMNALQMQAENAYKMTQQNANIHMNGSSGRGGVAFDANMHMNGGSGRGGVAYTDLLHMNGGSSRGGVAYDADIDELD
ncbi:hypothetical protein FI667_g10726, partial [Globisporangium splendens]